MESASSVAATFCLIVLIHSTLVNSFRELPTAYDVLEDYSFPVGLLPDGVVKGYDLNPITGEFTAYLNDTCRLIEGGFQVKYDPKITGFIANSKLSGVKGVSVLVLRKWRSIGEILRHGIHVHFFAGVAAEKFHIRDFDESPLCVWYDLPDELLEQQK